MEHRARTIWPMHICVLCLFKESTIAARLWRSQHKIQGNRSISVYIMCVAVFGLVVFCCRRRVAIRISARKHIHTPSARQVAIRTKKHYTKAKSRHLRSPLALIMAWRAEHTNMWDTSGRNCVAPPADVSLLSTAIKWRGKQHCLTSTQSRIAHLKCMERVLRAERMVECDVPNITG